MQTTKPLAYRRGESVTGLFCINDLRHKQRGDSVRQHGGGTGESRRECEQPARGRCLTFPRQDNNSLLYQDIVGSSKALQEALVCLPNVAATNRPVLLTGETGTGKEMVARVIHRFSHRSPRAFVRVNCAAIHPQLIASELFGQRKSSRSSGMQPRLDRFQLAEGGTIFLKNIGGLSAEAQLALLRLLQDLESELADRNRSQQVGMRLIAATDHDLRAAVDAGTFRSDLFCRINACPITLSPLRERREDISTLALYFLERQVVTTGSERPDLTNRAMNLLQSYPWPGNMRELQRVMERFATLTAAKSFSVDAKWVPWESIWLRTSAWQSSAALVPSDSDLLEAALTEMLAELPGWEPASCMEEPVTWDILMLEPRAKLSSKVIPAAHGMHLV
jgi:transcriptional regulator with GAF, ATPase, and Fis domain